jgi:hypothetical protein
MSSTLSKTGQQLPSRPNISDVLAPASASASNGSTNEAMSTSNQQADQATPRPELVTQADYIAADIMNRDWIDNIIDDLEGECAPDENATSAFIQMHQKSISIYRQALGHSSPVVSLNLLSLAQGMEQMVHFIDDSNTIPFSRDPDYKRIKDPDVDVEASKAAKLRLVKFMEDEAMILGNKDMENFLIWASGLVDWMNDSFEMTKEAILEQLSAPGGIEAYEKGQWREDEDED